MPVIGMTAAFAVVNVKVLPRAKLPLTKDA
jgi:hypothetical protein